MSAAEPVDDEQEILVYVDFGTAITPEDLDDPDQIEILGLDSDHPVVQVNGKIFKGDYEQALGTHLFFRETDEERPVEFFEQQNENDRQYEFVAKTQKVLRMKRMFVTPRDAAAAGPSTEQEGELANLLQRCEVSETYSEALDRFLPEGEEPPRSIPADQDGQELLTMGQQEAEEEVGEEEEEPTDEGEESDDEILEEILEEAQIALKSEK